MDNTAISQISSVYPKILRDKEDAHTMCAPSLITYGAVSSKFSGRLIKKFLRASRPFRPSYEMQTDNRIVTVVFDISARKAS